METSFVAGPNGFSTLVHVPLIYMKSALTIWEHHILPIPLQDDLYLNIGPAEYTHLAVTADHLLYRVMTRAEFNTCCRLGEFYLCHRGLVVTKAPRIEATPPQWKDPGLCLFALFTRRFKLAAATCMTAIGGKDAAMRMVAPDAFGSYTARPHRGAVTCRGEINPGGRETRAFTANGLTKITLPHGCTAETSMLIFAAADNGFSRSDRNYTISYEWPFDLLTLTPGLNTQVFSNLLQNMSSLENRPRHSFEGSGSKRGFTGELELRQSPLRDCTGVDNGYHHHPHWRHHRSRCDQTRESGRTCSETDPLLSKSSIWHYAGNRSQSGTEPG
jgi:hypothetical protein